MELSIFGRVMFFIALLWTFLSYMMYVSSKDDWVFLRDKFFIVIIGYVAIIAFTIFMKRYVASL